MSYCRFSSEDWKSDVYVYLSGAGYCVHVAGYRYTDNIPPLPDILKASKGEWIKAYRAQMKAVENSAREKISGGIDGKTFVYDSVPQLIQGLNEIKDKGYYVPQFVFDKLNEQEDK